MYAQAEPLLQLPPRLATVDASLAQAFQQAGACSSAHEDPLFPSVNAHLNIAEPPADGALADSAPAHQVSCPLSQGMRRCKPALTISTLARGGSLLRHDGYTCWFRGHGRRAPYMKLWAATACRLPSAQAWMTCMSQTTMPGTACR